MFKLNDIRPFTSIGIVISLFIAFTGYSSLSAQDANFTQQNMAPLHFNPAFSGNTFAPMIHLNSRVQWSNLGWAYNTMAASYDQFFNRYNSGVGVFVLNDISGNGIYNTLRLEGTYAYALKVRNGHYIKMGLGLALVQNRLDWEKLIFLDQIDPDYGYTDEFGDKILSSELTPENLTNIYPDFSVGVLYYSNVFYSGVAIKHASSPENDFTGINKDKDNGLALRYTVQLGGQILLNAGNPGSRNFIHPSVMFSRQANIDQLTFFTHLNLGMIYAGIGYRHAFENPDAFLLGFGIALDMYTIGYSYDLTVSGLGASTGGTHELGIRINFDKSDWFEAPLRYADCFEIFR